jgi:hypothetical protein
MTKPVTLASLRPHGVRQLLVYCQGKREGDWPCHHQGTLPVERFRPNSGHQEVMLRISDT